MDLGFIPQRELVYNKHLPYCKLLDEESNIQLEEIKKNLSHAVQLRDIHVGAYTWSRKLNKLVSRLTDSLVYNKHLPYCKLLDEESNIQLEEIKKNLSHAVRYTCWCLHME